MSTYVVKDEYYSRMARVAKHPYQFFGISMLGMFLVSLYVTLGVGEQTYRVSVGDTLLPLVLTAQVLCGAYFVLAQDRRVVAARIASALEPLVWLGLLGFAFGYVFALNANLDYVQRFAATGGDLRIAPDTRSERMLVVGRYAPVVLLDLALWLCFTRRSGGIQRLREPLLVVASIAFTVLAQPSSLSVAGLAPLAWVAPIPLLYLQVNLVERGRLSRAWAYGIVYGTFTILVGNSWLATFNLLSLQVAVLVYGAYFTVFFGVVIYGLARLRRTWRLPFLVAAWTAFEYLRSVGFLGYPWSLQAHAQYRNVALLQWASIGGVWLVGAIVVTPAVMVALALPSAGLRARRTHPYRTIVAALLVIGGVHAVGAVSLLVPRRYRAAGRVALVQQNTDPRKHAYQDTFDTLRELTDQALIQDPRLVVWSETAFVPNIRRWSQEDPRRYRYARLVRSLSAYLQRVPAHVVTGNDDYRRVVNAEGHEVERMNFNAAVHFLPHGRREATYHKIRLVPFTEHFPYARVFPRIARLLQDFDVTFWTPGTEYTVFDHPDFRFATPICFEDVFPGHVRRFARAGAEVIVNLSNDYWSLNPVAAQQHLAAAQFRAAELQRPMLRATASGVTAYIDDRGRLVDRLPQFVPGVLTVDVAVPRAPVKTVYYHLGDWVAYLALVLTVTLLVVDQCPQQRPSPTR